MRTVTEQPAEPQHRPDRRRLPSRKVVPASIGGLGAADSIEEWTSRSLDAAVCGEMARSRESGGAVQARKFLVGRRQPAGDAHPAETTA